MQKSYAIFDGVQELASFKTLEAAREYINKNTPNINDKIDSEGELVRGNVDMYGNYERSTEEYLRLDRSKKRSTRRNPGDSTDQ